MRDWHHRTVGTLDVETPHGPARAHLRPAVSSRGAVVLGHGAAGGIAAPDLEAASEAALAERFTVALVEQPYRVAGRRSPRPRRSSTPLGSPSSTSCARGRSPGSRS